MDSKGQTTVLSLIFILVGMMFVVSAVPDEALASTSASVNKYEANPSIKFNNIRSHLDKGKWQEGWAPKLINDGHAIEWATTGSEWYGGDESGHVDADVGTRTVTFDFSNPQKGDNTCDTKVSSGPGQILKASCTITQATYATANYVVSAQERNTLKVKVFNWADCDNTSSKKCPALYNMITTVTLFPGTPEKKSESFQAGPCESAKVGPCVGPTKEYEVHAGDAFEIEAKQGSPPNCGSYTCVLQPIHFVSNPTPATGNCGNIETSTGKCDGTVPSTTGQITIDVNYHWRYD
jgi:hypothetical protein